MNPHLSRQIDADIWDFGPVQLFFFTLEYFRWTWAIDRYEYDYPGAPVEVQWDITLPFMMIQIFQP